MTYGLSDNFLLTANRNCPMRRFLRRKTTFGYFCWEMPIINMGVSREGKCLLNIVSQKQISYDFGTSFVLQKVKKTFGGSKWKLVELTRVSRYLAYVIHWCCHFLSYCLMSGVTRYSLLFEYSKNFKLTSLPPVVRKFPFDICQEAGTCLAK